MKDHKHTPAKAHNFSLAFEQMCSIVAIGQTQGADETLMQLLLQCIVLLPDDRFFNAKEIANAIDGLFGLQIPEHEITYSLERLLSEDIVRLAPEEYYVLPGETRSVIQVGIDNAYSLEKRVRDAWQEELSRKYPAMPLDKAWKSLRSYLAKAFQRHGMQTVALLDPLVEIAPEYSLSLSELLNEAVNQFPPHYQKELKNCVSSFLATIGNFPDRASYVAQLADGAFNYFSLTVEHDIAEQFRRNLNPLKLFLDTNFLIGILDLDIDPQVAVSNELIKAIQKYNFPFELIHHQRTKQELLSSISRYADILGSRNWSRAISRAASTSRYLSGVESKYHQQYAKTGIDVDSFFKPYRHADILLEQRNIMEYIPETDRLESRSELINEYQEYLNNRYKGKSYNLIDHDMTVLDVVRCLRSNARSTLDAGALLITRDYLLYRFDWESSRNKGILPCTALPNMFWQILRPYVPSDVDFSRSFAETFAIPEFRSIGSGSAEAASKMLSILAGYKDFPEETASRMLSNDLLIDKLRQAENDNAFQEYVESAIVSQNAELSEEMAALLDELEQERTTKEEIKEQLDNVSLQRELEQAQSADEKLKFEQMHALDQEIIDQVSAETEKERALRRMAERSNERTKTTLYIVLAIFFSTLIIILFEFTVYRLPWQWLISHPESYGLQASIDVVIISCIFAVFIPKWRKWFWITVIIPIIVGIFPLLGGPTK